ncbi:reverse transcriptase [Gossypium australe]|uniref:Reverse transcriptase n=1 Tax=Gossypium australe TaxID=47621 RepID=A0A5B6WYV5_9ROSI|nr:reverse transcriptase [Gossypium australe]
MTVGKQKMKAFANYVDRFQKRIQGWNIQYFLMGGKEVFIKSILQAIPCFILSKLLCHKLVGLLNKFWWSNNKSSKGIHWSNWMLLCKLKDAGGWGLEYFNLAHMSFRQGVQSKVFSTFRCNVSKNWFLPFGHLEEHLQCSWAD